MTFFYFFFLQHSPNTRGECGAAPVQTPGGTTEESPRVSVSDQRRWGQTIGAKMTEEREFFSSWLCGTCLFVCLWVCVRRWRCCGGSVFVSFFDLGAEDISAKRGIFFFVVLTSTKLILMAGALFQYWCWATWVLFSKFCPKLIQGIHQAVFLRSKMFYFFLHFFK